MTKSPMNVIPGARVIKKVRALKKKRHQYLKRIGVIAPSPFVDGPGVNMKKFRQKQRREKRLFKESGKSSEDDEEEEEEQAQEQEAVAMDEVEEAPKPAKGKGKGKAAPAPAQEEAKMEEVAEAPKQKIKVDRAAGGRGRKHRNAGMLD